MYYFYGLYTRLSVYTGLYTGLSHCTTLEFHDPGKSRTRVSSVAKMILQRNIK